MVLGTGPTVGPNVLAAGYPMTEKANSARFNRHLSPEQVQEIDDARSQRNDTRRPTCTALEKILYQPFFVLDKGFVRVVDYMGDDGAIVQGARVSYGRGTRKINTDRILIRYLLRHRHTTPFEMCAIKFHVKAPIFVTRQWFRHRTASINEYSARYSVLDNEFYFPELEHVCAQSSTNRQGRGSILDGERARKVVDLLRDDAARCYRNYEWMLNEDHEGNIIDPENPTIARELARINLPTNIYTQFYWKINLWNLIHFLQLRSDTHAQFEIRAYAHCIMGILRQWLPFVYEAVNDYVLEARTVSRPGLELIRAALAGDEPLDAGEYGLTSREVKEIVDIFPEMARRLQS